MLHLFNDRPDPSSFITIARKSGEKKPLKLPKNGIVKLVQNRDYKAAVKRNN